MFNENISSRPAVISRGVDMSNVREPRAGYIRVRTPWRASAVSTIPGIFKKYPTIDCQKEKVAVEGLTHRSESSIVNTQN